MSGELILIVDDSRENRQFIVDIILKPNRFRYLEARDGLEGLEIARRESPDLILLDLQMPRLDGRGVLEALRRENLNIPVVLMTFHGTEEIAVEVFRLGVRDYVKKPYTPDEMLAAMEGSLAETRLRREKEALTARLLSANRDLHSRVKELNTLYSIGRSVTALIDPAQLLARIVDAAIAVTAAEQGNLLLVENDLLVLRATRRRSEANAHPVAEISKDPLAERAVQTAKPVVMSPQQLAQLRQRNPQGPLALLYVPLFIGNQVVGVIGIENHTNQTRAFTDHDGAMLSALGDYAAIAIENARNFQALEAAKEREKMAIRGAFERYVAPSVVDRVLRSPGEAQLGGTRREISVLFADVRGFTPYAEQADPEHVVELLNQYFAVAADIIFAREGTLDKFLGDAVMAFFNAPEEQDDHPYRAVDAALALQQAVGQLNARRSMDTLQFGIGVALGEVVVGNVGTTRAMNYTATGDAVNVAKRLQERASPGQILVEEAIIRRLGDLVEAQRLGELHLEGRRRPAIVYELHGLA